MPTKPCNVSITSQTLQSTASLIINWAWASWVAASTRASVSGRKLLTLLFAYCVVNQHPVFLQYSLSVSLRVMTRASYNDGRSTRNFYPKEAQYFFGRRLYGNSIEH